MAEYTFEVGNIAEDEWNSITAIFDDATIYQTYAYGSVRWGHDKLSHAVIRRDGDVVGAAQAIVYKVPVIKAGIAYIPWGPLWRKKGTATSAETLAAVLAGLKNEYCVKRGLLLRMTPGIWEDTVVGVACDILQEANYERSISVPPYRTLMLDLARESAEIRKKLDQKWRNQLNRSEKNGLEVIEGTSGELYDIFLKLQRGMQERKHYIPTVDYMEFGEIQKKLPESMKMHIVVCRNEGEPLTATIGSAIGGRGIYLLGATGEAGMKQKSAYLSQWRMILWLRERGCRWFDLGGIDPESNPGVYHFKVGMSSMDVSHIGQYETNTNILSSTIVKAAERLKRK